MPIAGVADRQHHVRPGLNRHVLHERRPSSSTFAVSIVKRPPDGIASRALTTRFISTCSSCPGSARTVAQVRCQTGHELHVLADQPAEHLCIPVTSALRSTPGRLQHLLPAEREQLARERRGPLVRP